MKLIPSQWSHHDDEFSVNVGYSSPVYYWNVTYRKTKEKLEGIEDDYVTAFCSAKEALVRLRQTKDQHDGKWTRISDQNKLERWSAAVEPGLEGAIEEREDYWEYTVRGRDKPIPFSVGRSATRKYAMQQAEALARVMDMGPGVVNMEDK